MNDAQLDRLTASARSNPPDTGQLEYGFENRLLARLRAEQGAGPPWVVWIWRLVPVATAVVVALGIWAWSGPRTGAAVWPEALVGSSDAQLLLGFLAGE